MVHYDIEKIGTDHPLLLTGNFEACAIALCAKGASPWPLAIDCKSLPKFGRAKTSETCGLAWQGAPKANVNAEKARETYQPKRLTEDAAIGVCAAVFAALGEGQIDEVTWCGSRVDYWVDKQRALLEISGIEKGDQKTLAGRHSGKTKQLKRSPQFPKWPGYVFVVAFGQKSAIFSYHDK